MAVELVTGYQGKDHVTAEQWADFNRGIFGEAAILPVGNRMETAIQTANQITIKDGVAVFDGRQIYIAYGESENIAIQSGTQGMLRRDIVVLEYTRDEESGVEGVQFKVITGTPAASGAKDPSVQDMDIRTGVTVSQKPFCRVRLNGTAIEGVDALVQVKEFKPHAFAAPVNNLAGTNPDLALAAPQGRELKKQVDALNSALKLKVDTYYLATAEVLDDTLKINIEEPASEVNVKRWPIYDKQTKNMPDGCYIAIRDFMYFNDNWFVLQVTELYPQMGRRWYRHYDKTTGTWSDAWISY